MDGTQDVLQPMGDGFDVPQVHRPGCSLEAVGGAEEVRQQRFPFLLGRALFQGQQSLVERAQVLLQLGLEGDHQLAFDLLSLIHLYLHIPISECGMYQLSVISYQGLLFTVHCLLITVHSSLYCSTMPVSWVARVLRFWAACSTCRVPASARVVAWPTLSMAKAI